MIREQDGRYSIEFQTCGERVFRRLPKAATMADAEALETKLRREIFKDIRLDDDGVVAANAAEDKEHKEWRRVVSMLLHATGVQPATGVYFLCKEGSIVYVGCSTNVAHRLHGHRDKDYDHVMMLRCESHQLAMTERFLIAMLCPPMNIMGQPDA